MKKLAFTLAGVFACLGLLSACGGSSSSSSASSGAASSSGENSTSTASTVEETIYRGKIDEVTDESITVSQMLPGYNYGQQSIVFHINEDTSLETNDITLAPGGFVEIAYNGALTRSMPAQGNASRVTLIAAYSDNIIVNGTIQSMTKKDDRFSITITPLPEESEASSSLTVTEVNSYAMDVNNSIVLLVPFDALEGGLSEADLVEGRIVSGVSKGISTMSLPPQMPMVALLPFSE